MGFEVVGALRKRDGGYREVEVIVKMNVRLLRERYICQYCLLFRYRYVFKSNYSYITKCIKTRQQALMNRNIERNMHNNTHIRWL